ncbi:MAG: DUF4235 domain-containing protein [Cellulomonadaceae bacterium]|nr:DUF4235 domain-containing protein [Cellulomonadaceae bacterium]
MNLDDDSPMMMKLLMMAAPIAAGWLAGFVLKKVWEVAFKSDVPTGKVDEDSTVVQAVAFAAASAGLAVLAKRWADQGAKTAAAHYVAAKQEHAV